MSRSPQPDYHLLPHLRGRACPLDAWLERRELIRQQEAALMRVVIETGRPVPGDPEDALRLRGVPVLVPGSGLGAIRGSRPDVDGIR